MIDNLPTKEIRNIQKEITELSNNFFIKISYILSENKTMKTEVMNDSNITLNLKMINSSILDKVFKA